MEKICISDNVLVTFQGINWNGLNDMVTLKPPLKKILRPQSLQNKVLKIDPATAICTIGVGHLINNLNDTISKENIGVIAGTKLGNYQIIKEYVGKVNSNRKAPTLYAASGYNICVSVPSLAYGIQGPTFVMAGNVALSDLFLIASNLLKRQDVKVLFIGKVDVKYDGESGICIMFAVTRFTMENESSNCVVSFNDISRLTEGKYCVTYHQEKCRNIYTYLEDNHEDMLSSYLVWEKVNLRKNLVG